MSSREERNIHERTRRLQQKTFRQVATPGVEISDGEYISQGILELGTLTWDFQGNTTTTECTQPALCKDGTLLYEVVRVDSTHMAWRKGTTSGTTVTWASWHSIDVLFWGTSGPGCTIFNGDLYIAVCQAPYASIHVVPVDLATEQVGSWMWIPGASYQTPDLEVFPNSSTLQLIVIGTDTGIYRKSYTIAGGWTIWVADTAGAIEGRIQSAVYNNGLYIIGQGIPGTWAPCYIGYWNSSLVWQGWTGISQPSGERLDILTISTSALGIELFAITETLKIYHRRYTGSWGTYLYLATPLIFTFLGSETIGDYSYLHYRHN